MTVMQFKISEYKSNEMNPTTTLPHNSDVLHIRRLKPFRQVSQKSTTTDPFELEALPPLRQLDDVTELVNLCNEPNRCGNSVYGECVPIYEPKPDYECRCKTPYVNPEGDPHTCVGKREDEI